MSLDKGVYIDLDTIFDTRLTVLKAISPEVYNLMLKTDYYDLRLFDEFDFINNKVFNTFYKQRDNEILKRSFITKAVELLALELDILVSKKVEAGVTSPTFIDLNIYPYTLTEVDKKRLINAIGIYCLFDEVKVNFVNISPFDLSMSYISGRYGVMIMYHGSKWLDYQMSIKKLSCSDIKLYVPALLDKPVIFKKKEDLENVFNSRDTILNPFINITSLPMGYFNVKEIFRKVINIDN